jgi:hypothetical protein
LFKFGCKHFASQFDLLCQNYPHASHVHFQDENRYFCVHFGIEKVMVVTTTVAQGVSNGDALMEIGEPKVIQNGCAAIWHAPMLGLVCVMQIVDFRKRG